MGFLPSANRPFCLAIYQLQNVSAHFASITHIMLKNIESSLTFCNVCGFFFLILVMANGIIQEIGLVLPQYFGADVSWGTQVGLSDLNC